MISHPFAVLAVLATVVFVSVQLEDRFTLFRSLGSALVGILLAMLLSNVGVIPGDSPTYTFLFGPGVTAGIALILLSVDVRSVVRAGPTMLAAFAIGAVGTAIGSTVAGLALHGLVGAETWKLAGQYTGTYVGGGMNFVALAQAFHTSSDLFTAATAADVIVTAVWMAACLAVPVLLGRPKLTAVTAPADPPTVTGAGNWSADLAPAHASTIASPSPAGAPANPGPSNPGHEPEMTLEHALHSSGRAVPLADAAALVAITVGSMWIADRLYAVVPSIPSVLWLTSIVLLAAQIPAIKTLAGSALWGNYLMLLFLASNGARSVVANIFVVGPPVFYFAAATVLIHGMIIFGVGRLFRIDLGTLAVASQANVGGAASAMALASARGYGDKVLPGIAVGLLGYAGGTYVGFGVGLLVRQWLGG